MEWGPEEKTNTSAQSHGLQCIEDQPGGAAKTTRFCCCWLLLLGEGAIFPEFVMRRVQIPSSKIFLSPDVFLGVITTHQFRWMKMESEHHTSLSLYRPSTKTPFNGDGIRVIIFYTILQVPPLFGLVSQRIFRRLL